MAKSADRARQGSLILTVSAWGAFSISFLVVAGALVMQIVTRDTPTPPAWGFRWFAIALSLTFSALGLLLTVRIPRNMVGWLFAGEGLFAAFQAMFFEYVVWATIHSPDSLPMPDLFAWLDRWWWVVGMGVSATVILLIFPDGRLVSRRWRLVLGYSIFSTGFSAFGLALSSNPMAETFPSVGRPGFLPSIDIPPFVFMPPLMIAFALSATSLFVRFRRSGSSIERDQVKWVAYVGVWFAVSVVLNQVAIGSLGPDSTGWVTLTDTLVLTAGLALPLVVFLAVLRYRLYEIDVLISRTLVYAPLTAVLAGTYSGATLFFRFVFVDWLGVSSDASIAGATLLIAALFLPVKNRLQSWVDHLFKEDELKLLKAHAQAVVNAEQLRSAKAVADRHLALALATTGAASGRVVVAVDGQNNVLATEGLMGEQFQSIPIRLGSSVVGSVDLAYAQPSQRFRTSEIQAIEESASLIASVITSPD